MNQIRLLTLMALAALCASGCASRPGEQMAIGGTGPIRAPAPCQGLSKSVTVTITVDDSVARAIDLDFDPVCAQKFSEITWTFSAADKPKYAFAAEGAFKFKNGQPWFTGSPVIDSNGNLKLSLVSFRDAAYEYQLTFTSTSGQQWTCDPTIVNYDSGLLVPVVAKRRVSC